MLASFIAEIVTHAISPASTITAFVVVGVLTDLLAARFLPSFLRALAGLEVSVGSAFVALLAGTITTDVLMIAPVRSLDALTALQDATDRLRTEPDDLAKLPTHEGLIDALRRLQDRIVQTGRYDARDPSAILRDPTLDQADRCLRALGK